MQQAAMRQNKTERMVLLDELAGLVAGYFGLLPEQLAVKWGGPEIVAARHVFIFLARTIGEVGHSDVNRYCHVDHSEVRRITRRAKSNPRKSVAIEALDMVARQIFASYGKRVKQVMVPDCSGSELASYPSWKTHRRCLRCCHEFPSDGPGHRRCLGCSTNMPEVADGWEFFA